MDDTKLVRMANQIAQFFASYPEAQAVDSIRDHLEKFWEPRMRRAVIAYAEAGGDGLLPLAKAAVDRLHTVPAAR